MNFRNGDLHMQLFTNIAYTSSTLFIPVYASDIGADSAEIGAIVAAYSVALLLSNYTLGRLSDIYGRRSILAYSLLFASAMAFLQLLAVDPAELLAVRFLLGLSAGSSSSLIAYAIDLKRDLGSFSSFASLGSAIGQGMAGIVIYLFAGKSVGRDLLSPVFALSAILLLFTFFLSLGTAPSGRRRGSMRFFPPGVFRRGRAAFISLSLRHFGATAIWALFPLFCFALMPPSYSYGERLALVSLIYVLNSVVQVLSMRFLTHGMSSALLVQLGIALSSVTFLSFTFARNFYELAATQILLGIAWSFMYVGGLRYVVERSPDSGASAGMLASLMALSGIGGPVVGGALASTVASFGFGTFDGYIAVMYMASALTALAAFVFYRMEYRKAGDRTGRQHNASSSL
ncbi:MAG: MFS transporter [Thermoplasmata archaeon]|uniref:MFS transporter n=1 Tax=Candidatus Sysuiplasma superficiale TaxID=2823368 RepID=A0A8J7YSD4_9ARCH|nr:MFS transporter [Candidatus Sysuiplasma superficiale]MBX8643586.1 MFS transporter [Candidatus Sysuiplasma superficiale]